MPSLRSLARLVVRGAALVAVLGFAAAPASLAAAAIGHCAGGHDSHAGHGGTGAPPVAAAAGNPLPGDCPHCPATGCAGLAPCAGSATAVAAAATPLLVAAGPVRTAAAPLIAGSTSLALAPPTPPPLPAS